MRPSAAALHRSVERLVQNIDRDAARFQRLFRQLAAEDRRAFVAAACRILQQGVDSPGKQHLIAAVISEGLLFSALLDPQLESHQAIALARAAARIDPALDVALARALAESSGSPDSDITSEQQIRLMELLQAISGSLRIHPTVVRLLRHSNPHVRSKAVLMIGRGNRSTRWIRERLSDPDPRVRANAAEALWDLKDPDARELLLQLARDSNNRVAGNAILGLYRLGDLSVIPEIIAMARHESAMFRATAAWIMGETRDPRFTEAATALLRESNPIVRKRAVSAVANIRAAMSQAAITPNWRVTAAFGDPEPAKPGRRVLLGVAGAGGAVCPPLEPGDVLISEDGEPVLRYSIHRRSCPEALSVVFIAPRSGPCAAAACLAWKRPSDLWAILRYLPHTLGPQPADGPLRFCSNSEEIAVEFDRVPFDSECVDVWRSLAKAIDAGVGASPAPRSVIVFTEANERHVPGDELRKLVLSSRAYVQVIAPGSDARIEEFCRAIGAVFRVAAPDAATDAYLGLLSEYEIVYQPVSPNPRSVRVRVCRGDICAERTLTPNPLPAGS